MSVTTTVLKNKKTGKYRHRYVSAGWFREPVFILEIQYEKETSTLTRDDGDPTTGGGHETTEEHEYTYWKDATVKDVVRLASIMEGEF